MAPKVLHGFCRRTLYEAGEEEGGAIAHKTPKSTIDLLRDFLFPAPFFLFSPFFSWEMDQEKTGRKMGQRRTPDKSIVYFWLFCESQ